MNSISLTTAPALSPSAIPSPDVLDGFDDWEYSPHPPPVARIVAFEWILILFFSLSEKTKQPKHDLESENRSITKEFS